MDTPLDIVLVHICVCSLRGSFSKIDGFIITLFITNQHESTAANTRVVASYHANTKCRRHCSIDSVSLSI